MAKITEAYLKDLLSQVAQEKITFSRMVELLSEKAHENEIESLRELIDGKDIKVRETFCLSEMDVVCLARNNNDYSCTKCCFYEMDCSKIYCCAKERKDETNVIFKRVGK